MEEFAKMHFRPSHQVDRTPWTELREDQAAETPMAKTVHGFWEGFHHESCIALLAAGELAFLALSPRWVLWPRTMSVQLSLQPYAESTLPLHHRCWESEPPLLLLLERSWWGLWNWHSSNTLHVLSPFASKLLCFPPVFLEQVIKSRQELSL